MGLKNAAVRMQFLKDDLLLRVLKNAGIVLFGNSTASVINIVSFAIMARALGPDTLALLVLAQTYALIINDIFNIQTWESMVKFGSYDTGDVRTADVIKTNFTLDFVSAVAAFVFALLLARPVVHLLNWDPSLVRVVSLYSLSILFRITTFTIGIPRLFDKFSAIAKIQVATAILKVLAVSYAMYSSKSFIYYLSIYLCIDILTNLLLISFSTRLLKDKLGRKWWRHRMKIDKNQIRFIWWTNLRTIIRIPVQHFDMIVISSVMTLKMVGIYKVYKEIAGFLKRIQDPINQAIFPEFTRLLAGKETKRTASMAKKSMMFLSGLSIALLLLLLLTSKMIVGKFFGAEYLEYMEALYLMLILYLVSFITVPVNSLFIASGFAKSSFMILLFTNTIYLATAFAGGMTLGIYGIIMAYAVQLFFNRGLKIYLLIKYSDDWGNVIR